MKVIEKIWFQPYTPFVILIVVGFLAYKFIYPPLQELIVQDNSIKSPVELTPSPSVLGSEDAIIEAVGKLMKLPTDEKPQIISITDSTIADFTGQPFFKDAQSGHVLLIYHKNKKAILFDPKEKIIINTAPISVGLGSETTAPTETASPSAIPPSPTPTRRSLPLSPTVSPTPTP